MKHLTIVRHAKAKQSERFTVDFDRPLASKGLKQIPRIAQALARLKAKPEWIISSPATRARQTAEGLAERLDLVDRLVWEDAIYEASAPELLSILQATPDTVDHAVIVGHNPGMEDLVSGLTTGDNRLNLRLTTAGVAYLQLEIFQWKQLRWGSGELRLLLAPSVLK
jgi:phosphohistidine phosphatase